VASVTGVKRRARRAFHKALGHERTNELGPRPDQHGAPQFAHPASQACTAAQIADAKFVEWCERIGSPVLMHRKLWEWCYILEALESSAAIVDSARGVGFGVGREPIASYLVSKGCHVTVTDLPSGAAEADHWSGAAQWAADLDATRDDKLCTAEEYAERAEFRPVDMRSIPADFEGYDFSWSSCAFEHLGTLGAGLDFIHEQMRVLRPGGVAVHTTELNVCCNLATIDEGETVLYRRRDLQRLQRDLAAAGHSMTLNFTLGDEPADRHVDTVPWTNVHLNRRMDGYVITSFGMTIRKGMQ
jgi:SAM-dependent methyltransferase